MSLYLFTNSNYLSHKAYPRHFNHFDFQAHPQKIPENPNPYKLNI